MIHRRFLGIVDARRLAMLGIALVGALIWPGPVSADEGYPSRRIRIVVPYPPGAQTDMMARLIADGLSRKWGQQVVVDNIAGAAGNVGTSAVFRSDPDGYTLLVVPPSFVTNSFVQKNTPWVASQWAPISIMATAPYVLLARANFPGATVKDLIDQSRAKPGVVSYASGGVGSSSHLAGVQLEMLAGIKMAHVPYRGATPALNDIMAGHVDVVFDALVTALPFWQDGKVKALALGSKARAPIMRDVPTIAESGVPEFEAGSWAAILAPPATSAPVVEKLSAAVRDILKEPAVAQRIRSLHMELLALDSRESAAFIARETAHWENIVRKAGITPQ